MMEEVPVGAAAWAKARPESPASSRTEAAKAAGPSEFSLPFNDAPGARVSEVDAGTPIRPHEAVGVHLEFPEVVHVPVRRTVLGQSCGALAVYSGDRKSLRLESIVLV